jgi:lipopolysaccharide/colanic/teichoic acid biosynthesis glycosyltransferase
VASAGPGDHVVLAATPPAEAVAAAEALRPSGVEVVIDVEEVPALRRGLARRIWGIDAVVLPGTLPSRRTPSLSRLRDVIVAGIVLASLAPVLLVLAWLVKRSSPGPALYATTVVGRDGRPFIWRKLRSMRLGDSADAAKRRERYRAFLAGSLAAEDSLEAPTKVIDEARVTPIGRLLRRHSLDEIPQLWNVLRGEMTLVGPRPALPYEYDLHRPWHRLRYRVTPGLTGPWQAYGRGRTSFDEMALIDYCYTRVRSFGLDLRIIARTLRVVVSGEGGR